MNISVEILFVSAGLLGIFLIFLTVWLLRISRHYNRLISSSNNKSLTSVLEGIQKTLSIHEKKMNTITSDIKGIEEEGKSHIQTVSLKRFNPFSDTGGDQSFILSLLDGNRDGFVITSLHSRENTRFYVKSVTGGVGADHPLSSEEQKVVNKKR